MNAWRLALVIAAASAALAGCDYRDATGSPPAPAQASAPESAPPVADATRTESTPAAAQPAAPVDATPAPVEPTTTSQASPTQEMGAAAEAMPSDGTAAPTELGRFLEESARKAATRPAS